MLRNEQEDPLKPLVRAIALALAIAMEGPFLAATAEGGPILGVLKGPSGIALVKLFDNPPQMAGGRVLSPVAVGSADIMAAKLIGGEFQAAVLPLNMAAKLRASGIPIVLGAVIGNGMLSLLTSDTAFASLRDLRGKELDVAGQGATPDYLIRRLLADAGLNPETDVHLAYALPYPEMAAALSAGKIAYALLPEPFATQARLLNPALRSPIDIAALWQKSTGMADYPMTVLVFRTDARLVPADLRMILDAAKSSIAEVIHDPRAAGRLVEKHELGLKASVAEAAIPRCNFVFQTAVESRNGIEAILSEFLKVSPASIGGKLPDAGFYGEF